MKPVRVLAVDDSAVTRRLLTLALTDDTGSTVCGTAHNGQVALAKVDQLRPDVVVLDLDMPVLDGLATLAGLRRAHPRLPVIMFSALTERGAAATLDALAGGANDYVTKPAGLGGADEAVAYIRRELLPKITALGAPCVIGPAAVVAPPVQPPAAMPPLPADVVAIGVSTGGPNALAALVAGLPADLNVPVVVVQHMPAMFTRLLAERLDGMTPLRVQEAAAGAVLEPGGVWLAPGDHHLVVLRDADAVRLGTHQEPPVNRCRPAVDVLFDSVAAAYGPRALGIVLTGMGRDGLAGSRRMRAAGAQILVQDEASSVVWGMPRAVAEAGLADRVLPLDCMAAEIARRAARPRPASVSRPPAHPAA